jgi:hypothetical protein
MSEQRILLCDKCGKQIEGSYPKHKLKSGKIKLIDRLICGIGPYDYGESSYDLCFECYGKFYRWIRNIENGDIEE